MIPDAQSGAAAKGGADLTPAGLGPAAANFTAGSTPNAAGYKVGPLDILDVTVFKVPELSRPVQVGANGSFNFPLVGEVPASGHTAQEIERTLTARLGARYLQSPQVSVFVKEFNSQRVTVEGAVKKPGVYPLRGTMTLVQAIAVAEGLDRDTASSVVLVFRQTAGGRAVARFDLDQIRSGGMNDPQLMQGDTVVVESSQSKVAFGYFVKALPVATIFRVF